MINIFIIYMLIFLMLYDLVYNTGTQCSLRDCLHGSNALMVERLTSIRMPEAVGSRFAMSLTALVTDRC